jgi:hypothetical protein
MLKINKSRKYYTYVTCTKAENKEKENEKIKPNFESTTIFLYSSFFLYFPVVDIDGLACCILACIVIAPVLL